MVEGGGVPFSVFYFDGEKETNVGTVMVYPSLNFKNFQSVLSQKIGISPHQFSVYLASLRSNRKIPITGKANFAVIAREMGAFFLVKRSRRSRKHKTHSKDFEDDKYYSSTKEALPNKKNPPGNLMLLRRNTGIENQPSSGFKSPIFDRVEYETRIRNLQIERERFQMNTGVSDFGLRRESNGGGLKNAEDSGVVCEECSKAKQTGRGVGFHLCVYDAVIVGFRTQAGPIARPVKSSDGRLEFGNRRRSDRIWVGVE